MGATGIKIEGLEDCLRWMEGRDKACLDACKNASKQASRATVASIKKQIPSRFRRLAKYKLKTSNSKGISVYMGLFATSAGRRLNDKSLNDKSEARLFDWFKAYWLNYGTLEGRDPSHQFTRPVKKGRQARNDRTGIVHRNFFESAVTGWERVYTSAFEKALKNEENTLNK